MIIVVHYISWFHDTNENHENGYSTKKNEFTVRLKPTRTHKSVW
jgi:hypothetical protein